VEPFIGFQASQTHGGPTWQRAQGARGAQALGEDLLGGESGGPRGGRGRWVVAGERCGLCPRARQQACHGHAPCLAGVPPGGLPEQVASLLAHGLTQLTLQGRIGGGEWLGQIPQRVGLAALMTAVGQARGDGWHPTRVCGAEDGQNRPLQGSQGREKRLAGGLIQLRKPPTAQCQPGC
jgi:hypothetical protein